MQLRLISVFCILLAVAAGTAGAADADSMLKAGAAKVDITGPLGPSQSGKYEHERIYVRTIVLDNGTARAALISFESAHYDFDAEATLKAVGAELNCPLTNVIMSVSHTHSGSITDPPSTLEVSKPVLESVRQAVARLQPARMGFGTGSLNLNVNRDAIDPETRKWTEYSNLDALSDKSVSVLTFARPSGEPIAVYVNYAMHAIDGFALNVVSGDFPGAMSRYVEKAFGDDIVVLFTQGASGDQNPLYLRPAINALASRVGMKVTGFELNRQKAVRPPPDPVSNEPVAKTEADPKLIDDLFRFIESEGQIFGEEVIRVMTWTKMMTGNVTIMGLQRTVSCPGQKRKVDPAATGAREGMEAAFEDAPPIGLQIGALRIGDVALGSINIEVYGQIGLRVKSEAPLRNTVLVTSANGKLRGYLPDDASYGHQTFQVLGTSLKPGCGERAVADTIADLEAQLLRER